MPRPNLTLGITQPSFVRLRSERATRTRPPAVSEQCLPVPATLLASYLSPPPSLGCCCCWCYCFIAASLSPSILAAPPNHRCTNNVIQQTVCTTFGLVLGSSNYRSLYALHIARHPSVCSIWD